MEVIIKTILFFSIIFIIVFSGCSIDETSGVIQTEDLPITLSLAPAFEQGFNVTRVSVTITRDGFIDSMNLTIEDSTAYGTFYDLQVGIYEIFVEVYDGDTLIATGYGIGEVVAGETTIVYIILELCEFTGNLEIIVEWGDLIPPVPEKILFIGNSITYWNGGVDTHLENLALSADSLQNIECSNVTFGGYTLENHYNNPTTIEEIQQENWDIVVLQEMTSRPVNDPELFYEYATLLDSIITETGAQTVFFFSWPFQDSFEEMIEAQAAAFNYIGAQLDAPVIPVARAWQLSIQEDPLLNLYDNDGNHPNHHGTYLAACVFYAYFWNQSPVEIPYVSDDSITEEEQLFLQDIAWDTYELYNP